MAMKNLGDLAKRFLQEREQGQQQQQAPQYMPPPVQQGQGPQGQSQQPQVYGGQPRNAYAGAPPYAAPQESGARPAVMRGAVPPNPYYTPPPGYQPPYPQQYPPQGY